MATDETGEVAAALPGYDIGGELGRGAFGVVLSGRHRRLGRQVAIKQLPRALSDFPEVRSRFSAEAKILASLDHPHIVPIFDYVEHGGLCLLVMELLPGGTVRERQRSGMSGQAACAVTLATCSALDFAHQRGVLHRDVKPDNLLFTSAGLLKVTDFGIAKVVGDVALTRAGETPGTPLYMAPEQCLDQPLSPATDVYSTGLMLYELLAGAHPFAGNDAVSTMYHQVHVPAPPLPTAGQSHLDAIAPVVMRALAKDPTERYSSARAFGGALADAAAAAWGLSWPAGDALRIMSPGPIEATTGRSLTSGPLVGGGAAVTRAPAGNGAAVAPLLPTVTAQAAPAPTPWVSPAGVSPAGVSPAGDSAPGDSPPGDSAPRESPASWLSPPRESPASWLSPGISPTRLSAPGVSPPRISPPPTETYWPPVPPPPRRRHTGLWVAVGTLLVALAAGGAALAISGGGKGGTAAPTTTARPPVAAAPQVAADLNRLIQRSAQARGQLVATVASIENCSANPTVAARALAAAVTTRQDVVRQLGTLGVDALPNGAAMRLALTNALNDSIDADRHFQDWLAGITSAGGCQGQAPHDVRWQSAQTSSGAATGAKQTFAALWNPVAATYGLPAVSSATI